MKFSIITPYDGNARFLNWTAKSLALQMETKNFEWIVVHDEALDLAVTLGENFALVTRAIAAKKGFETAALNSAMETANGDYLWILPAGCMPGGFERIKKCLARTGSSSQSRLPLWHGAHRRRVEASR
jgi:hypothetical protein